MAFVREEVEMGSEMGVLEICPIHGPGREHANPRISLAIERGKLGLKSLEERRQPLDLEPAIDLGHDARQREAVLERIAGARGCLGAVAEHPPMATGRTPDIDGIKPQMPAAGRPDPDPPP